MALQISVKSDHENNPSPLKDDNIISVSYKGSIDDHVEEEEEETESGRERLKRHRKAVAGQVWIPDKWGKEELLKDWIDSSAFEASLFPSGILSAHSARLALVTQGKRSANNHGSATATATATAPAGGGFRILNSVMIYSNNSGEN